MQQEELRLEPQLSIMQQISDNTALMRQLQNNPLQIEDKEKDDASALITLFDPEEDSDGTYMNSTIYSEHLMSLFEHMQLPHTPNSSTSTEDSKTFDELAGLALSDKSSHTSWLTTTQDDFDEKDIELPGKVMSSHDSQGPNKDFTHLLGNFLTAQMKRFEKSLPAMPPLGKFRILIIGQTGVGKSTMCSKSLGIDEDAVKTK